MSVLSPEMQARVIACLVDGVSVNATARMTDVSKVTILRLLLLVGEGCARLHDRLFRDLPCSALQFDEQHSFVGKKTKNMKPDDGDDTGEQWTFVALDVASRAAVSYLVGKRTAANAAALASDVRRRVNGRPMISSDGFKPYVEAVEGAFGANVDFGMLVKMYAGDDVGRERAQHYKGAMPVPVQGAPDMRKIHTSYVERNNLTTRTNQKRFTRRSICFSKSLRHHKAAVALHYTHYNLCHVLKTLRTSPAMALGVTERLWSIDELVTAALAEPIATPAPRPLAAVGGGGDDSAPIVFRTIDGRPAFTLIRGGKQ